MTIRCLAVALSLGAVVWARGAPASGQVASGWTVSSAHVIAAWYSAARTAPTTPVQLSRVLAMVHAAMHDAVNGAEPRYETYATDLIDVRAHPEAAAAGAAHRVLSGLFPALQASWDAALVESLSTIHDGRSKTPRCYARRSRRSGDPQRTSRGWMEHRGPLRSAARAWYLETDSAGLSPDARTAVSERDAFHHREPGAILARSASGAHGPGLSARLR